jgi:hypothetical protein
MARLGENALPGWIPLKPKGMRWANYARTLDQIKTFDRIADGKWLKLYARLKAL